MPITPTSADSRKGQTPENATQLSFAQQQMQTLSKNASTAWQNFKGLGDTYIDKSGPAYTKKIAWKGRAKQAGIATLSLATASLPLITQFAIMPKLVALGVVSLIAGVIPTGFVGWAVLLGSMLLTYLLYRVVKHILLKDPKQEEAPPSASISGAILAGTHHSSSKEKREQRELEGLNTTYRRLRGQRGAEPGKPFLGFRPKDLST